MESERNVLSQSTAPNPSSRKLSSNFLFYPLAYLMFLFLLTICLEEDVEVEVIEQADQTLSVNTKAIPDISINGHPNTDKPFALTNSDIYDK
ncbi:MAG: hypothetical protein D3924_20715 [Candidatus Electrothrix sp. AR4]|nr:hypothetical protein [Candidatus Electrothrix sp. AR4]